MSDHYQSCIHFYNQPGDNSNRIQSILLLFPTSVIETRISVWKIFFVYYGWLGASENDDDANKIWPYSAPLEFIENDVCLHTQLLSIGFVGIVKSLCLFVKCLRFRFYSHANNMCGFFKLNTVSLYVWLHSIFKKDTPLSLQ